MNNHQNTAPAFLFLGTGAADWQRPEPSGEYRAFSSMLAFGSLLFDCSAHVPQTLEKYGVPLAAIEHVLITHSHPDHLNTDALWSLLEPRAGESPLVYASAVVAEILAGSGIRANAVEPFRAFSAGQFRVTPITANHSVSSATGETSLYYLVNLNGYTWLYATDGAWLPYASWAALKDQKLDALIIDATIGDGREGDYRIFEHNSLPMIRIMAETMRKTGVLKEKAPVILTHLARTLHPDQETLERGLEFPFIAAHDGMRYN